MFRRQLIGGAAALAIAASLPAGRGARADNFIKQAVGIILLFLFMIEISTGLLPTFDLFERLLGKAQGFVIRLARLLLLLANARLFLGMFGIFPAGGRLNQGPVRSSRGVREARKFDAKHARKAKQAKARLDRLAKRADKAARKAGALRESVKEARKTVKDGVKKAKAEVAAKRAEIKPEDRAKAKSKARKYKAELEMYRVDASRLYDGFSQFGKGLEHDAGRLSEALRGLEGVGKEHRMYLGMMDKDAAAGRTQRFDSFYPEHYGELDARADRQWKLFDDTFKSADRNMRGMEKNLNGLQGKLSSVYSKMSRETGLKFAIRIRF